MPDTLASCRWIGVTETGSATTSPPGAPFKPAGQGPRSSVTSVEVAASLSFKGRKGTRPPPSEPHGCPLCAQDILEEEGPLRSCHSLTSGNVWALTMCRRTCASGVGLVALKLPFSPRGFAFPPLSSCSDFRSCVWQDRLPVAHRRSPASEAVAAGPSAFWEGHGGVGGSTTCRLSRAQAPAAARGLNAGPSDRWVTEAGQAVLARGGRRPRRTHHGAAEGRAPGQHAGPPGLGPAARGPVRPGAGAAVRGADALVAPHAAALGQRAAPGHHLLLLRVGLLVPGQTPRCGERDVGDASPGGLSARHLPCARRPPEVDGLPSRICLQR